MSRTEERFNRRRLRSSYFSVVLSIALVLFLLGLFPILGSVLMTIPKPVLGGATLVMFGTVAVAGIRILSTLELDRRTMLIMAVSFGLGLGVAMVPDLLKEMAQEKMIFTDK